MSERIAKIESTFLGYEDHGILTAVLHVTYGGTAQGIGFFGFDEYDRDNDVRVASAFGMEWVARCIRACGVDSWEKVKGCTILALFDSDAFHAQPIGIKPLPTERGEEFIFADIKHMAEKAA